MSVYGHFVYLRRAYSECPYVDFFWNFVRGKKVHLFIVKGKKVIRISKCAKINETACKSEMPACYGVKRWVYVGRQTKWRGNGVIHPHEWQTQRLETKVAVRYFGRFISRRKNGVSLEIRDRFKKYFRGRNCIIYWLCMPKMIDVADGVTEWLSFYES